MRQIVCNIACKTASLQQEQRWWWWWLWSVCDAGAHPSALCLRTPVGTNQSPRRDGGHQSCCSVKFEKTELLSFFFREWFGSELGCQATRWTLRVPATGGRAVEATPAMDTATMGEWASSQENCNQSLYLYLYFVAFFEVLNLFFGQTVWWQS